MLLYNHYPGRGGGYHDNKWLCRCFRGATCPLALVCQQNQTLYEDGKQVNSPVESHRAPMEHSGKHGVRSGPSNTARDTLGCNSSQLAQTGVSRNRNGNSSGNSTVSRGKVHLPYHWSKAWCITGTREWEIFSTLNWVKFLDWQLPSSLHKVLSNVQLQVFFERAVLSL